MKRSPFFEKTIILICSNILTGTMTFIFSMIVSRRAGAGAMGLYQLVMPLYALFLCIAGGGITVSMSKIAADQKAKGDIGILNKTVKYMCILELFWSLIICVVIFLSAFLLSTKILKDSRTFYSILAFCPAIIFISISSVYKGAFYGVQRIVAPAFIDIFEKIFRLLMLITLINLTGTSNVTLSSAAIVFSLSLGELFSMLLFIIAYKNYARKQPCFHSNENGLQLTTDVLKLSLPLAFNGIIATIFSTIMTVLIPSRLQVSGVSYETALSTLGKLQGMAMAIVFYPTVVISSFNVLLVPALSEAQTMKKNRITVHHIDSSLRIAAVTAFSTTAVLLSMPMQLGLFFFKDTSIGSLLKLLAPGVPFVYFLITSFAILNGLGRQKNILINSTILSIIDLALIYSLMSIPSIGVTGYAIDFIISSAIGLIMNFIIIKRYCTYSFDFVNTLLLPPFCSLISFFATHCMMQYISNTPILIIFSYLIFFIVFILCFSFFTKSSKIKKQVYR